MSESLNLKKCIVYKGNQGGYCKGTLYFIIIYDINKTFKLGHNGNMVMAV